jgi:Bacterial Ig-like domain
VVVDRTPPLLTARSPAPGADQVAATTTIEATFNEALDPASLFNTEDATVVLFVGPAFSATTVPVALTLSPDGRTVTATPAAPLATASAYTVVIEGLTDRAGNPMTQATWSFSVPLFALSSPDLRSTGPDGSFEGNVIGRPEIALASNGEPLVVWRQGTTDGRFTLQAARRIGAVWVPLPVLPPVGSPNSAFGDQSMALDNTGQPVVAWTQTTTNTAGCNTTQPSQLFVARFNGNAWVPLGDGNLNIAPCSLPYLPRLKVDLSGRPVLVSAQGAGGRTIQVRRFEGGDWTLLGTVAVQTVPVVPLPILELRLALDGNTPYVLRSENRSGSISHFVARLDGSAFVPVGTTVEVGNRDVPGALAFDPQARPVVALQSSSGGLRVLRFEGGGWTALGSVVSASSLADEPSIVFDGNQPIVGWHDNLTAFVRRFDPVTQDWGTALTIRTNVGTLSELRRLPSGGPIWSALTTDGFRCCLRTVTADALP